MGNKTPEFRVEVREYHSGEGVGFISREDDENPNSNTAVRYMSSREDVADRIAETIRELGDGAGQFTFMIDKDGHYEGECELHDGFWVIEFRDLQQIPLRDRLA